MYCNNKTINNMKNFKIFIGAVLLFVAMFIVAAIDSFSFGGTIIALIVAFLFARDGGRLIIKYSKQEVID